MIKAPVIARELIYVIYNYNFIFDYLACFSFSFLMALPFLSSFRANSQKSSLNEERAISRLEGMLFRQRITHVHIALPLGKGCSIDSLHI